MGNIGKEKPTYQIFMAGIDCVGKTTILYKLKLPKQIINANPTIGFNTQCIERQQMNLVIWQVGGGDKIRLLWRHYVSHETQGLIYVIDMSDKERFQYAVGEMQKYLLPFTNQKLPLLIFANKIDQAILSRSDVLERIQKSAIGHPIHIQYTNAQNGMGLNEGISWMMKKIQQSQNSGTKK